MDSPTDGADTGLQRESHYKLFQRLILAPDSPDLRGNFHPLGAFDVFARKAASVRELRWFPECLPRLFCPAWRGRIGRLIRDAHGVPQDTFQMPASQH